jgi:hypothetical protein
VNTLVLSITRSVVPSGTRSSCYREPKSRLAPELKQEFSDSNLTNKESNFVVELGRIECKIHPFNALTFGQSSSNDNFSKCEFKNGSSGRAPRCPFVSSYIRHTATIVPVNYAGDVQTLALAMHFGSRRPWNVRLDPPVRESVASSGELPLCATGDGA